MPKLSAGAAKRDLRITFPASAKEVRLMNKAAKIVDERPTDFAREAVKRVARMVLRQAGVQVRLGMDDFGAGKPLGGQNTDSEG